MERWWWNRERQRPLKPRNRSIPWLLFKRCTCGAEIESSLHTFRYGNILNPYSKAVPAVIAKASAIYNPFIYAITHGNYRWAPQTNYATLKKIYVHWPGFLFLQGRPRNKSPLSAFLEAAVQRKPHVRVSQRFVLQGLGAEQTVVCFQNQVLQNFLHVYDRHSESVFQKHQQDLWSAIRNIKTKSPFKERNFYRSFLLNLLE